MSEKTKTHARISNLSPSQRKRTAGQSFFSGSHTQEDPSHSTPERDGSFFQPKLLIHPAHDPLEAEADRVADRIVNQPKTETSSGPGIQKRAEQEDSLQEKPLVEEISTLSGEKSVESGAQRKPAFFSPSELDSHSAQGNVAQMKGLHSLIVLPEAQVQREEEDDLQRLSRTATQSGAEQTSAPPGFEGRLADSKGRGEALSHGSRSQMEQGFGTDFSGVRVHTDPEAVLMNRQIGAQAFTHGSDIYFNEGKYQPGTQEGDHLLAHELTHTIQQGGIQRKTAGGGPFEDIQASFIRDLIDEMVDLAGMIGINVPRIVDNIPGYTLFSYITEYDIIRGRAVERNAHSLIRGLMGLVPGGELLYQKLNQYGVIDRAFAWLESELSRLNLSMSRIERTISEAWDEMGITLGISGNLAVLQRKFGPLLRDVRSFADSLLDQLLEMVKEALIRPMVEFLETQSPAVRLAYKVLGRKFPLEEEVDATTVEILEDFLILIGKETEVEQMRERGTLQETADWIDTQLARFFSLVGRFQAILNRVWDAFSVENLADIPGIFQGIFDDFMSLLEDFFDFAREVAIRVLEIIKDALLEWLNSFAADIPGFTLLTVILGRNPLTDQVVERSVQNIIRGFMGLIPGGEAKYQELRESGVIPRAAGRIEALIAELGISWAFISQLFTDIWDSLSIEDLIQPIAAFERIAARFGEPISRLFTFVSEVVKIVIELILQMMGIPPDLVYGIIENAMAAFEDIKNDPIGFLFNLMNAIKEGFLQFFDNIGTHLLNGLQNWLFGTLGEAGIEIPEDLSVRSILGMAMQVLGITVDNILDRLALRIGEERVAQIRSILDTLTGIWAFIRDVMERGPIAIWEYVQSQLSNLWDIIRDGIMGFIQERVIQQAVTWLLSFLDVTGIMPIIRGVQTVFNAVRSFIEKLREILEIISSFVAGIAEIAQGNIQAAADFLERALAGGIPVAISFLARQLGLGDIAERIEEMIEVARGRINEAIDWLIDQALRAGTAFLNALGLGGGGDEGEEGEDSSAIDAEEDFNIGQEDHELTIQERSGRLTVMMSSENIQELSEKIELIAELEPFYRDSPAGNFSAELSAIQDQGQQLIIDFNSQTFTSDDQRNLFLNRGLDQIALALQSFTRKFGIRGIEGISDFIQPPQHNPNYGSFISNRRATGVDARLSYESRSHMRSTNPSALVSGLRIKSGYQRGHLLAASLGGSNSERKNFAPQSALTNVSQGGFSNYEGPVRNALNGPDVFPPWIFNYRVSINYSGGLSVLQSYLSTLGASNQAASNLFALAENRLNDINSELTDDMIIQATGLNISEVTEHRENIVEQFVLNFNPRSFSVSVEIEQGPENSDVQIPSASTLDNHR